MGRALNRRIRRPAGCDDLEGFLVRRKERDGDTAVFDRLVDLLAFAAVLAAVRGDWEELPAHGAGESIPEHIFEGSYAGLFYFLALLRAEDATVLGDDQAELRASTFEGYANAGMRIIRASVQPVGDAADELESLILPYLRQLATPVANIDVAAEIAAEFGFAEKCDD